MPPGSNKQFKLRILLVVLISPLVPLYLQLYYLVGPSLSSPSSPQISREKGRPDIHALLTFPEGKVIGDPQFLLDLAIVGFPKCGTTALQDWLSQHPQIQMLLGEPFPLMYRKPYLLIWKLYNLLPEDQVQIKYVRGYKNPLDVRCPTCMNYLGTLFPKTPLIIGLRHPVRWFESLYNFKVQNLPPQVHPGVYGHPNDLIDECEDYMNPDCVGTAKGWFHVHLAALGKVAFPEEWRLEYPRYLQNVSLTAPIPNPVFLYETNQLQFHASAPAGEHSKQFREDLANLLHLETPLDMPMSRAKPDNFNLTTRQQRRKDRFKIRICEDNYKPLRSALMTVARRTSEWIRNELLQSPDVVVSSPDHFRSLIEGWMLDPCDDARFNATTLPVGSY